MRSIFLWRSILILLIAYLCLVHCQKAPSTASTKHQSHGPLFSNGTNGKPKGGLALIAAGCPDGNNRHKRQFTNCHYRLGFVGVAATGAAGVGAASQFRQYNGAAGAAAGAAAGGQAAAMPQGGGGGAMAGGMPGGQPAAMPQGGGGMPPQQPMGGGYPAGMGAAGAGGGGGMGMGMGMGGAGAGGAPQRQPPPGSPSRDAALKLVMDALLAAAVPPMGARHKFAKMKMKRMRKF